MLDPERVQRLAEFMAGGRSGMLPFGKEGPVCTASQGIYTLAWQSAGKAPLERGAAPLTVIMDFDFVTTERRTGETHAELTVNPADPIDPFMQYRTRLNLTSLRSRSDLAKQLAARVATGMDWNRMLDQAVQFVLTNHRSGEPAVLLPDAEEPDGTVVSPMPPILAADGATIIFGDGGASKSFLALAIAASLQAGFGLIPGIEPTNTMKVGYLDWEWSAYVHKRRLRRLVGDDMPPILYLPCRLALKEERDRLRRVIREYELEFLIVDSVALAAGGEPESAEIAVQFFSILRELAVPTLLIAHVTNAAAKGQADRPFGSAFWHNSARSTWYLKRSEESIGNTLTVALYHRKSNDAPVSQAIGLRWIHDSDRTYIERVSIEDEPSLETELPTRKRISLLLRRGPMTIHEIAEETGIKMETVRKTLQRGSGMQFLHTAGSRGQPATWALLAKEEAA